MRFLTLILFSVFAIAEAEIKNVREGDSSYLTDEKLREVSRVQHQYGLDDLSQTLNKSYSNSKSCSVNLIKDLRLKYGQDVSAVLLANRYNDYLDDVSLFYLFKIEKNITLNNRPIKKIKMSNLSTQESLYLERFLSKDCLDKIFLSTYQDYQQQKNNLSFSYKEAIRFAYSLDYISSDDAVILENLRKNKFHLERLTWTDYLKKQKNLRLQQPLKNEKERSSFMTQKVAGSDFSRRIYLYENYSEVQILLMANLVKSFKERLDSMKIELTVFKDDQPNEVIALEPMERFRFSTKMLRKEMNYLYINSFFENQKPDYEDLITAAYEVGFVTAAEVDQVYSLEDVWSPKKTLMEKIAVYARFFGGVVAVAIPQPYGFVPALVIIAIEASIGEKRPVVDDTSLF